MEIAEKLVTVRDKGRITIPAEWRERYGFVEGSAVRVVAEEGRLVIYPSSLKRLHELLDRMAAQLTERGVTLEDLLEAIPEERAASFRRAYPDLAREYGI